ncbi:MAG: glycosyltransferase [Lachnospiraceae bacterium]|nr:glycosyltransferase [Lachnospiraceae bacterium]
MKVSVIVPVYDTKPEYFDKCIGSLTAQTHKDIEILVIDDGAVDELALRCDMAAKEDERIRVIHQENAGASGARNRGLSECTGDYVTFVDSDDWIDEHTVEEALRISERDSLDILLWGSYKCYGSRQEKYMPYEADITLFDEDRKKELMQKTMVGSLKTYTYPATKFGSGSCCSKLYRRDFLEENKLRYPVGVKRAEDVNFNIRAFNVAKRIGYLNRYFYYYRQHASSATYIYRKNGIEVFTKALEGLDNFIRESGREDLRQTYYMRCMFFFLESMDMDYMNPAAEGSLSERLYRMRKAAGREPYRTAVERLDYSGLTFFKKIPLFFMKHGLMGLLMLFYKVYGIIGK